MPRPKPARRGRHRPQPEDAPGITLIERLMRHYKLTIRDLAAIAGTSPATLQRIAKGEIPRLDVAMRIAATFRVAVEDIWSLPEES